jgi:glycosyltransferase involved in cell wall biosynthesis
VSLEDIDGPALQPYYRSAGFDGPPALTFLTLQAAGWTVYPTCTAADEATRIVASTPLFDAAAYAARAGGLKGLDPALHYVLVGEQLGIPPSDDFDPAYYGARYPDVAAARMNRLVHYVVAGKREGRRPVSVAHTLRLDTERIDSALETVLLFAHEASRTGAPILAYTIALGLREKYNVVAVPLAGGELFDDFEACCSAAVGPIPRTEWNDAEASRLVQRLCASYRVRYAIANSIETRFILPALAHAQVPVVTLVHEFASYTRPAGSMGQALDWSTEVVFSAEVVARAALKEHPTLAGRVTHVIPQGPCHVPAARITDSPGRDADPLAALAREKERDRALVVLSCGTVHLRKGVDLFLTCAASVARRSPARPVRFVWIGAGYDPEADPHYSCYLADQIERAGLEDMVTIVDAVPDLEPAYALADVFLLSSRLDPLPNVAIDASLRGIPVLCFEHATGIADVLADDEVARRCVAPYLDVEYAAALIARIAGDEEERAALGAATRRVARAKFDTQRYVRRLDDIGTGALDAMRQRRRDFAAIRDDELFDAGVYVHPDEQISSRDDAIHAFLARWSAVAIVERPATNGLFRRPCVGFHPQIYAYEHRDAFDVARVNPLAHFIRSGKPAGAWWHGVIAPEPVAAPDRATSTMRVALHGHFYYPQLAADLFRRLAASAHRCDLLLTTDTVTKADLLMRTSRAYTRGKVSVHVVPNRGRDIGPLLTLLQPEIACRYDIVGHVHGKRSLSVGDGSFGERWREFLWQHLIGDTHPMLDLIIDRFVNDPHLGIVFPEDPYLSDWDDNRPIAAGLAARMGIDHLPPFFDFPNGTMFWARAAALQPLFDLALDWDDYPPEPIDSDGTLLHALERLLPFSAARAGYRYATSHVPGVTR